MAEEAAEAIGQGPDVTWSRDLVLIELRRAAPDSVGKTELQDRTGLGPEDLREALKELEGEGAIEASDAGYAWLEDPPAPAQSPPEGPEETDAGETPAGDGSAPERAGDAPRAVSVEEPPQDVSRYSAIMALQVDFYPELAEGEEPDEGATREARDLLELARDGISGRYPSLLVNGSLASIEAFDTPRTVYPKGK